MTMQGNVFRTPKTVANWTGLGKLFKEEDPVVQIEYGLHVWKDQEPVPEADRLSFNDSYYGSGNFSTIGYDPNIEEGEEMLLELNDGKRVPVTILSYDFGIGTFQLNDRALGKIFDE